MEDRAWVHHGRSEDSYVEDIDDVARRYSSLIGAAALGASADLASKALAPRVGLTTYENPDLSLGLVRLDGSVALVAIVLLAAGFTLTHSIWLWTNRRLPTFGLAALLGGVAANAIDRLTTGSVTDWVPVGPVVLNLADLLVWLGLGLYLAVALRNRDRRSAERGTHETPSVQVGAGRQRRGDGHRHDGAGHLRPLTNMTAPPVSLRLEEQSGPWMEADPSAATTNR